MNVWLDDIRDPMVFRPELDWFWVKSIEDVKPLLKSGNVEALSLDNDLGENEEEGRKLVLWMAEKDCWPEGPITVHSSNVVASQYMREMVVRYAPRGTHNY